MRVHELYTLLGDAIAAGYRESEIDVNQDDKRYEIVDTTWYDLGPGLFIIEIE